MARFHFGSGTMSLPRIGLLLSVVLLLYGVSDFAQAQSSVVVMSDAVKSQLQLIESSFACQDYEAAKAGADRLLGDLADQEGVAKAIQRTGKLFYKVDPAKATELFRYNVANHPDHMSAMQSQGWLVSDAAMREDEQAVQAELAVLTSRFAAQETLSKEIYDVAMRVKRAGKKTKSLELHQYNVDHLPASEHTLQSQLQLIRDSFKRKDHQAAQADVDTLLSRFAAQENLSKEIYDIAKRFERARNKTKALELHRYNVEHFPVSLDSVPSRVRLIHDSLDRKDYEAAKTGTDAMLDRFAGKIRVARPIQKIAKRFYETDRAKALELYRSNIANYPGSEFAMYSQCWLVRDAIDRDDEQAVQEGIDTLVAQCSSQETLPNQMLNITSRYLDADKPQKADDMYRYMTSLLGQEDDTLLSLKAKAIIEIKLNRFAEAKEFMNAMYRDFSDDRKLVPALIDMAQIYHHAGQDEEALVHYNYILTNHPEKELAMTARKRAALAHIGLGQDEQVQATIEILKVDYGDRPDLDQAIFLIGEGYYKVGKDKVKQGETDAAKPYFAKALPIWQIIVDELPESNHAPEAHYFVAVCHRRLLQFHQAIEYWQKVVDTWPNFKYAGSAQSLVGSYTRIMRDRGDIPAEDADPLIQFAYENVIANYKNCPSPHVYELALKRLGELHMKNGRWEEAAMYYETYRMEFPEFVTTSIILYNLVEIYESMGEPALAIDVCEEFIQFCPDDRRIDHIIAKLDELTAGSN